MPDVRHSQIRAQQAGHRPADKHQLLEQGITQMRSHLFDQGDIGIVGFMAAAAPPAGPRDVDPKS